MDQTLQGEGWGPWVPELRVDGTVEIWATYFDDDVMRYVSGGVSPRRFITLYDNNLLKYQRESSPRPEGCPTRKEVAAFLSGDLKPVSRKSLAKDPDKEVLFYRDPPAYPIPDAVRQRHGVPLAAQDDSEEVEPSRPAPAARPVLPAAAEPNPVDRGPQEVSHPGWDIASSIELFRKLPNREKIILRAAAAKEVAPGLTKESSKVIVSKLCTKLRIPINSSMFERRAGLEKVIALFDSGATAV